MSFEKDTPENLRMLDPTPFSLSLSPIKGHSTKTGVCMLGSNFPPETDSAGTLTLELQPPKRREIKSVVLAPIYGALLWEPELTKHSAQEEGTPPTQGRVRKHQGKHGQASILWIPQEGMDKAESVGSALASFNHFSKFWGTGAGPSCLVPGQGG